MTDVVAIRKILKRNGWILEHDYGSWQSWRKEELWIQLGKDCIITMQDGLKTLCNYIDYRYVETVDNKKLRITLDIDL